MLGQTIMTTPVVTIHPDDTLADAITLMDYHRLSGLAVVDHQGRLCGILSEGDLLRRTEEPATTDGAGSPAFANEDGSMAGAATASMACPTNLHHCVVLRVRDPDLYKHDRYDGLVSINSGLSPDRLFGMESCCRRWPSLVGKILRGAA